MKTTLRRKVLDRLRHPVRHWRFWCVFYLTALLIAGGVVIWKQLLEDRFIPKRWGVVEDGRIYRSGMLSKALVKRTLAKHNIRVVISLINEEHGREDQNAERAAVTELGIERLVYPLDGDGRGEIQRYADAIAGIVRARKENKPVLVHCVAGVNRTGGVVCMYRVLVEKKPPTDAYAEMLEYDWDPDDNWELLKYLNDHIGELARLLVEKGVIDRIPDPVPRIGP